MDYISISSRDDLKAEILRLEDSSREQSKVIAAHFSSPAAIFSTIFSLFSNPAKDADDKNGGIFSQDFVGLISRFILPFTLNKTIFRNSNFLVKAIVGLVSQKASHFINEESVSNIWHKVAAAFETESGSILNKISSIFSGKKPRKGVNHPSNHIEQANKLRPVG